MPRRGWRLCSSALQGSRYRGTENRVVRNEAALHCRSGPIRGLFSMDRRTPSEIRSCTMGTVLQDIRYGIRQLIKMPGFTVTAILSLALGIGATTAVFSVVYAILMDPYPYKAPNRMVHMRLITPTGGNRGFGVTGAQWQLLRKSPVVEDTFLEDDWSLTVTGS